MPPYALTFDAQIPSPQRPGYFKRYDSRAVVRTLNGVEDGTSNQVFWSDRASHTLMLRPQQLEHSFLDTAAQLPYVQRLSTFQGNPANTTGLLVFEAAMLQNADNPWIFHSPISPTAPIAFTDSPEQIPGLATLENSAGESGSVTGFPGGGLPGVSASDIKVICWSKTAMAANMPLYLRWFVAPNSVGHKTVYDFYIGQFCMRCGPATVEVYEDLSPGGNRAGPWALRLRSFLFTVGGDDTLSNFGNSSAARVGEYGGHARSVLWLPYRRNYVYLESSYGTYAVFKCHDFARGNGMTGAAAEWDITRSRNIVVAGLTPGPGAFQIQKVKFADGPGVFNLPPFTADYLPTPAPANNWLVDQFDTPRGSTLTHTTPTAASVYNFKVNTLDGDCPVMTVNPTASDQFRTYQAVYTMTPGTDPADGTSKTYTPFFYGTEVRIPNETTVWPITGLSIADQSLAAPSARVKSARITATLGSPGSFEAEVMDLGESLASRYFRQYYPLSFSDQNADPTHPLNWTTLWLGIAEPPRTRELRLDAAAPRELTIRGADFWKWLNESILRENRSWGGVGHITCLQSIMEQGGVSIAGWDGPAAGSSYDDPLGGPDPDSPELADGTSNPSANEVVQLLWRPKHYPPDSYGSFIRRVAELWSGWSHGFNADGTFAYFPFDYYSASEMVFHSSRQAHRAGPCYQRGTVEYEPLYPDANVVQFFGTTAGGSALASNIFVDTGSLVDPLAVNFLGKGKQTIVSVPGATSCVGLNRGARAFFERARRRRLRVHFEADYVPSLKLGHCFQLEGIAGTWRLESFAAQYQRKAWNQARYEAELVEKGYGR